VMTPRRFAAMRKYCRFMDNRSRWGKRRIPKKTFGRVALLATTMF
jgi:hypothetical protein